MNSLKLVICLLAVGILTSQAHARGSSTLGMSCQGLGHSFSIEGISSDADGDVVTGITIDGVPATFQETSKGDLGTTDTATFAVNGQVYQLLFNDLATRPAIEARNLNTQQLEVLHCNE